VKIGTKLGFAIFFVILPVTALLSCASPTVNRSREDIWVYARRDTVDFSVSGFWGNVEGSRVGGGWLGAGVNVSPIQYLNIGLEGRFGGFFTVDPNDEDYVAPATGIISPALGVVLPFGSSGVRLFSNAMLELGTFGYWYGIIANWVTPAFDIGLDVGPILDGGFNIRYRGIWFQGSYAHSVAIGITFIRF